MRLLPFEIIVSNALIAGFDPIHKPTNRSQWRLAKLTLVASFASAQAFGTIVKAWRGSSETVSSDGTDWNEPLSSASA